MAKGVLGFSRGSGSNTNVTTDARNQVQRIARQKVSPSSHFSVEVNDILVDTKQSTQIKAIPEPGIAYLINLPGEGFRRGALRAPICAQVLLSHGDFGRYLVTNS